MAGDIRTTPLAGNGVGVGGIDDQSKTDQAKQQAGQVADQAKQQAGQVADQAKQQAGQVAGQARTTAKTQVDQRSTQAGELMTSQASDIRSISSTLREQGKDKPAQYVDQAASRIEDLGDYLKRADADTILHGIEDAARKRPGAIIAGGALLGFLASRFLKASSTQRYDQRYATTPYQRPNTLDRPAGVTPAYAGGVGYETSGLSAGGVGTTGGTGVGTLSSGVVGEPAATRTGQPVDEITETERARLAGETTSGIPLPPSTGGTT